MKVVHVINTLQAGGAELHLLTLCRHLQSEGVTPKVIYLKNVADGGRPLRPEFEEAGIEVFGPNSDGRFDGAHLLKCLWLLRASRPDLVHTHLPRADVLGAGFQLWGSNVPWVCSIHGIYSESWSGRWTLPLLDLAWRRADRIIAISHAVENWLTQQRGQSANKIQVIHYGIDTDPLTRVTANLRGTMKFHGRPVIGSIGRLEAGKGHEVLIRAMPLILEERPDAVLLIAGQDTWGYRKVLEALIDELHLGKVVLLVGFQEDVPGFLGALDVFGFASHSEGFGQVVIEAMAAAKPCVVRGKAPLTEIVTDKVNGRLAMGDTPREWARLILEYLEDPADARVIGLRAQQSVAQRFGADQMTARTLKLYDELLGQR